MKRPGIAMTNEHDCTLCSYVIEPGETITELSSGTAHVSCYSRMLPPERHSSPSHKPKDWRRSPSSYRPGVVS